MYHIVYYRVMGDRSRLLDFVPRRSSRAIRKAKRILVKGAKDAFSRLAVGAAENNKLAQAVASVNAGLVAHGQMEDAPGGEYPLGAVPNGILVPQQSE